MTTRKPMPDAPLQGEGNYDAARRHRESAERFVEANDPDALARAARPTSTAEARELQDAEAQGRARAHTGESPKPPTADRRAEHPRRK